MERLILLEKIEAGFTEKILFNLGPDGWPGFCQTEMRKAISGTQLSKASFQKGMSGVWHLAHVLLVPRGKACLYQPRRNTTASLVEQKFMISEQEIPCHLSFLSLCFKFLHLKSLFMSLSKFKFPRLIYTVDEWPASESAGFPGKWVISLFSFSYLCFNKHNDKLSP